MPTDLGGLLITYRVEIKTSIDTFEKDLSDCDGDDSVVISTRSCTIPVSTLRVLPFSLANEVSIYARVTAINIIGESLVSIEGNGATVPIPAVEPDAPTTFVRDE